MDAHRARNPFAGLPLQIQQAGFPCRHSSGLSAPPVEFLCSAEAGPLAPFRTPVSTCPHHVYGSDAQCDKSSHPCYVQGNSV
jgi:hypothetical protein